MPCPHCGEDMIGDGFRTVRHCPNAGDDWWEAEPDASPIYCHHEDEQDDT